MIQAIRNKNVEEVQCVIKTNPDSVNERDTDDVDDINAPPALLFATRQRLTDIAITLIKSGADINYIHTSGWTSLMVACFNGDIDIALVLLQCGADPNITSKFGRTALMKACFKRRVSLALLLLQYGADTFIQDKDGQTCFHLVKIWSEEDISSFEHECFSFKRTYAIVIVSAVRGRKLNPIVGKFLLTYLLGWGPRMAQSYFPLIDSVLWGSYFGHEHTAIE